MNLLVLSFNDIPLILVIFQCFLFSILLVFINAKKLSSLFLALFLVAVGADALDTLIYWSPSIKIQYLQGAINIFFFLKFSVYLAPPMLYFYVKSTIYSDFRFTWKEATHLIPLGLFPFYLAILFATFKPGDLAASIKDYAILFNNPYYQGHLWARNVLYVGYCLLAYQLLDGYKERLKENFSNIDKIDNTWLKILVGGFLGIWVWIFVGYLLNLAHVSHWLGDKMGIIGNFFSFIFVNTLVVYSLTKSGIVRSLPSQPTLITEPKEQETPDQTAIEKLTYAMKEKKLFLDPELTIEQLAEFSSLSTRKISNTINRHFNQNFFDYINFYRVEEAKNILSQKGKNAAMLDVMADAGFNSKSTFYRAFKKHLDMTPTEFCQLLEKQSQTPNP